MKAKAESSREHVEADAASEGAGGSNARSWMLRLAIPRLNRIGWPGTARIARRPRGSIRVVILAVLAGLATGLMVALVKYLVTWLQTRALGFDAEHHLHALDWSEGLRVAGALAAAGLVIVVVSGIAERIESRRKLAAPIDAIEANAMRGGLLGLRDGISVVGPILTSVGAGASVGIEAAVTQVGATLASLLGQMNRMPRSEMRILVGSGAAAAIGAAYGAPLAGALYAFELILGEYSTRMLASVGLAAVAGTTISSAVLGHGSAFQFPAMAQVDGTAFVVAVFIGALCAVLGIVTMVLTSESERWLRRLLSNPLARFAAGAMVLGGLAVAAPRILGSGHAGIVETVGGRIVGSAALGLLVAKVLAASISLGVGFRGGLFSASLLIGALTGSVVAHWATLFSGLPPLDPSLCIAIGMASAGASIIGSPLAMIFLVLETGGSLEATAAVAVGAIVASFLTGRLFGYSFATWRFQQRGLGIEGGRDVSRFSALSIRSLVRPPKQTLDAQAGIDDVIRAVSIAGSRGTAVTARDGHFIGLIDPDLVEIASAERSLPVVATDLICAPPITVTDRASLEELLDIFRKDDRATIAVLDAIDSRKLIGCVRARDAYASASLTMDSAD